MRGLGDCIYQRAAVRELVDRYDVYLETPWPQLVEDLPIRCCRVITRLRMQERNARRQDLKWSLAPRRARNRYLDYRRIRGTILGALLTALEVDAPRVTFDLPRFPKWEAQEPYIVIRPATIRAECPMASRNPLPEYLARAAERLRRDFRIVSVAALQTRDEWALPPLPYADETYHAGELPVERLLALVAGAAGIVAGVGWVVPAALAYRVPLFLIYGGAGKSNGPQRIFDSRLDDDLVYHAIPDNFCRCDDTRHGCDKRISNLDDRLDVWAMGLATRPAPAMVA